MIEDTRDLILLDAIRTGAEPGTLIDLDREQLPRYFSRSWRISAAGATRASDAGRWSPSRSPITGPVRLERLDCSSLP